MSQTTSKAAAEVYRPATPEEAWRLFRSGDTTHTRGMARGYLQCGLAVMPRADVGDFIQFCSKNQQSLSALDITEAGSPETVLAPGADLRTDLPGYRVYENGALTAEVTDASPYWRDDLVSVLLGCSLTFDAALTANGIPNRQTEENRGPTMFITDIPSAPAGRYRGKMVVNMRPMSPAQAIRAIQITSRFPRTHGAPVHFGDPAAIGIADVSAPDIGMSVTIKPGEIPVFWACVATLWETIAKSRPPFVITHAPGRMFITSTRDETVAAF